MNEAARELLDDFNNGDWDEIGSFFNYDFELFLDYLEKVGLVGEIDYENVDEDYKNIILLRKLEKYPEETLNYICDNIITDVYPMGDGYYLFLGPTNNRKELAELFDSRSGRNGSTRNVAENVLNEDWWEPFWDTTDDVYRDVIDDLDDRNKNILAEYIIKNVGNQELSLDDYDDDLFHQFSEEQGIEGYFKITSENVMRFIGDEMAMKEMLKKDLDELKSELYNIHDNAYNTAYTDEIYHKVWDGLSEYFEPKSWKYVEKERYDGTKVSSEYIKIKDFYTHILDFLNFNKEPQYSDSYLDYYGEYIKVISSMMDNNEIEWLDFRIPEYADWSQTKKNINEIFGDYI